MKHDRISAAREITIGAAEFKAKCLDILARLGTRDLDRVTVTRHGKPVAELFPPKTTREDVEALFGAMKGTVFIPEGADVTAPMMSDEEFDAHWGILHR